MEKLAYVTGKYSDARGPHFVQHNIHLARQVSAALWSIGIPNICPHTNTHHYDGCCRYEDFLLGDLMMLERCDCLVQLPNWTTSKGSKQEMEHAQSKGIKIFGWDFELEDIIRFGRPHGIEEFRRDHILHSLTEQQYARAAQFIRPAA